MEGVFSSVFNGLLSIIILTMPLLGNTVRYEAEHLFARDGCNSVIRDTTASNDSCRVAWVGYDKKGHMQYGPNTSFFPGYYVATFRMKLNNPRTGINPVCILDITSRRVYPLKYHALRKINAPYFDTLSLWQEFKVGFCLRDTVECIQFRVEWLDSADLYVDYVEITRNIDTEDAVYAINLQDMNLDLRTDTFDFEMADRRLLLASIQGGANRSEQRLVLLHNDGDYEGQGIHRWVHSFDIPYYLVDYEECIENLVLKRYFKGCVLFDPGELDSRAINDPPEWQKLLFQVKAIATNFAALESLLIVTPRTVGDIDTHQFPIKRDLTNNRIFPFLKDPTGKKGFDYNLWLFKNRDFEKELAFKLFPYHSASPLRNAAEKLTDYAIRNKHWCFYADLRDAVGNSALESTGMQSIRYLMGYCDEGLRNDMKYYCREYEHIRLASEAGKLWIGDMNRIHNLSFFAGIPAAASYQQTVPAIPPLEGKIYVSFLSMDGDNPVLLLKHYRKDWDSPLRGSIPVSWGFPPKMKDLAPAIAQYFYRSKTANDYIIADVSGLGWHHTNRFDFDDFPGMLEVAAEYLKDLDIRVAKVMADRNADLADIDYLQRFVQAYPEFGGFVEGYWPPSKTGFMMVNERYPSVRLAVNAPIMALGDQPSVYSVVDAIRRLCDSNAKRPVFLPVIYNIYNPNYTIHSTLFEKLDTIVSTLKDIYGDKIDFVRQDVMMELVKSYYKTSDKGHSRLKNPGFESGLADWFISGNVSVDYVDTHGGIASVALGDVASIQQDVEASGGQEYRLKVWFRPEDRGVGIFEVTWYANTILGTDTVFSYAAKRSTDWLFYFQDIIAPTGTRWARIRCTSKKGTIRFDDIDFKKVIY